MGAQDIKKKKNIITKEKRIRLTLFENNVNITCEQFSFKGNYTLWI